jgi:hypothetical protein
MRTTEAVLSARRWVVLFAILGQLLFLSLKHKCNVAYCRVYIASRLQRRVDICMFRLDSVDQKVCQLTERPHMQRPFDQRVRDLLR